MCSAFHKSLRDKDRDRGGRRKEQELIMLRNQVKINGCPENEVTPPQNERIELLKVKLSYKN